MATTDEQLQAADAGSAGGPGDKIIVRNLYKTFTVRGSVVRALVNINLTVADGEFLAIVGPSGCGKTTLLRIMAGLEKHSAGSLEMRHRDRKKPLNNMVFQEQSVFPWMTVRDNVAYGLMLRGVPKKQRDEIVNYYIEKVGLTKFHKAYPFQLSGGMKQRVSLARAFANDPEVLLMDEPFAHLDALNRRLMQLELLQVWERTGKTVVYVTHSIEEAVLLSDRVVVLTASPGRIKDFVDIDLPRPRTAETLAHPGFQAATLRIWQLLESEARRAEQRLLDRE